jgi:hypothetical protein
MDLLQNILKDQPIVFNLLFDRSGGHQLPLAPSRPQGQVAQPQRGAKSAAARTKHTQVSNRKPYAKFTARKAQVSNATKKSTLAKPRDNHPQIEPKSITNRVSNNHESETPSQVPQAAPAPTQETDATTPSNAPDAAAAEKILERTFFDAVVHGMKSFYCIVRSMPVPKKIWRLAFSGGPQFFLLCHRRSPGFRTFDPKIRFARRPRIEDLKKKWTFIPGKISVLKSLLSRNTSFDVNLTRTESDRRRLARNGILFPRTTHGWRALHYAAWNDDADTAEFLFQHGADPTLLSTRMQTPLHVAVRNDSYKVAELLIRKVQETESDAKAYIRIRTPTSDSVPFCDCSP